MQSLKFPIQFIFKISTITNDFTAIDTRGNTVAYVKQKLFKLKEDITVYADESKSLINYKIKADQWIDFSAAYSLNDRDGKEIGKVARKGWASMWKAKYEVIDQNQQLQYHIREENGWVKVMDATLGQIPILNFFTGYLFNPSYVVTDVRNKMVVRIKKEPSFWGRKFEITKLAGIEQDDVERIILSLMMMILLERRRG